MKSHWLIILVPLVLAAALAVLIVSSETNILLSVFFGLLLLVVAFLSTPASLYILVFSMLLSPELMVGGLAGSGTAAGRGITLRFDDFLLVVIGFVWLAKRAFFKEGTPFTRTPLNGPIMFYIAMAVVSTLVGTLDGRVKGMTGFFFLLKYYEYVFIYFMVVSSVESQKQARNLLIASLVTCFLISLYAIAQIPSGARASAPFEGETGEPNTLGGYLVFMLAIVTGLILTPGATSRRLPLFILLIAGSVGLAATLSRSSFLAAAVVLMIVVGRVMFRKPLLAPVILIALLVSPWWVPEAVTQRIFHTFTQPVEEGQIRMGAVRVDTSTSDRLRSWKKSVDIWKTYPLLGAGVTGAPFMDAMYPRVLSETGTMGLVAFFILIGALFRTGFAAYRRAQDPFERGLALGFLLGFASLLVHAIGANSFIIVRIMEPFWLVTALVVRNFLSSQAAQPAGGAAQPDLAGDKQREWRTRVPVPRSSGAARTVKL